MIRHLVFRALMVCLATLVTFVGTAAFAPGVASAQRSGSKKSVAVGVIEGPNGDTTRRRILEKLKKSGNYEVTDAEDLRPGSDKGAYAAMAQALQVDAILVGTVSRGFDLTLSVIGQDGNLIEDVKLEGGSGDELNKAIDSDLETAIADPIGGKKGAKPAKPPPDEEEEEEIEDEEDVTPEGDDEDDDEKKDDDEDTETPDTAPLTLEPGRRPLELIVGARLYTRDFLYTDRDERSNVFDYQLPGAPAIIASTRIYPFAFFRDDALGNLGIMAKLEVGIATSTNYSQPLGNGQSLVHPLNTGTSEWQAGLRGRLPLGDHELGIFAVYGAHSFVLVGDEGPSAEKPNRPYPLVPDVNYTFIRPGFDGRIHLKRFTIGGHFAPRFLTSMKQIDQSKFWFPGATGSGVDFGAMLGFRILPFLDVVAGADFLRYGFDFNAIPNDAGLAGSDAPVIAGGATDTYLSGWAGVMLHLDGKAKAADGSVTIEAKPDDSESKPSQEDEEEEE